MNRTEKIWMDFSDKLLFFIKKRVNNSFCAEDILQDVFLKIHDRFDRLREDEKIESWIYQITRNAIIDHYRTRKQHAELPDKLEAPQTCEDKEIRESLSACLVGMVNHLPEKYRTAVRIAHIEGKPQKEITQIENISLSGAKSRTQRGRALLKEMLHECCKLESSNQIIDCQPNHKCCEYCR